ncbi:vitellogenin [Xylocopa sonorina]|uniref:vitellogenin n=1 Tax=Xylocopa sonorina TaxID=1818115 RepID=UPI00403B2A45
MWMLLTFFLLVRSIAADYEHGWKAGNEYTYLVRSRTLTGLESLSDQHTGVIVKGWLTIQVTDPNTLLAKLWNCKYAHIHKELPEGWTTEFSDQMLELKELPISGKPFEIKLKHGVIKDLVVDYSMPTWEVNIVKSVVSQLQVDSQGENSVRTQETQIPTDESPYGSFKALEDSVTGRCEVRYDITPLLDTTVHERSDLHVEPRLKTDGQYIEIVKTRNFDRCAQRVNYHFGITGTTHWEPGSNRNGEFLTRSSTSKILISGTLKSFTIHSSVTVDKIAISPRLFDDKNGLVASMMNLTLGDVKKISKPMTKPNIPESIGNLVYVYNNPFMTTEKRRVPKVENSNHIWNSDSISSVSSSEEAPKRGENPRSFDSSSSSGSSSSISSSEENDFWQPKPTLEDAPQNSLLPNVVGYNGKFIGQSEKLDMVEASNELISQIANELEDPQNIPTQETLEKFTMLCSMLRTMSKDQMSRMDSNMQLSSNHLKWNDKSQTNKQNMWAVFRDAVVQAGTGPAFMIIRNWITKGHVSKLETMDILSRIAKNARTPTAEYVKALFDLVTSPQIKDDPIVEPSAMFAFGELVRMSHVHGRSIHNRYPVHTFGRMISKHDQTVQNEYIPYLARELKKAVESGNSRKTQTYIMALGQIAHPKILSVLEPYLEGQRKVTTFQRTLIIAAMGPLGETNPKLLRSVLYKVYLNTMESHEVRCAAIFLLLKTDPPLSMLQRMAEFTRYDTDKQVNSAVKSTLTSMAEITTPQWEERAKKAHSVLKLLTPDEYSYDLSHGFVADTIQENQNTISLMILDYIGSHESVIPRALYLGLFNSHGGYHMPPTELYVLLSSFNALLDLGFSKKDVENAVKMATEKLAEELNIVPDEPTPLEGLLMWNSKYTTRLLPFDSESVRGTFSWIAQKLAEEKQEGYVNMNKLFCYDVTLAFPTETGLPFVYTLRVPILYKFSGTSRVHMNQYGLNGLDAKSEFRLVYSQKIQGRIGFVTPFDHQHFVSGVDVNFQTYLPMKVAMDVNILKDNVQLKIWPLKGEETARLMHYSVLPYTSKYDILSLRPVMTDKNTHVIKPEEIETQTYPEIIDAHVKVKIEANKLDEDFWNMDIDNIAARIASPWTTDEDKYCKVDVHANLNNDKKEPWIFTLAYDTLDAETKPETTQEWTRQAKAMEPTNKEANSADRRKQFMKEVARGIKLAKSHVVDVQFQVPDKLKFNNVFTLAWSTSRAEKKSRSLLYWHLDTLFDTELEVCAASQLSTWPESVQFFDQAMKSKPKSEFNVNLRYGETCSTGEQINIKGVTEQRDELRKAIKETPEAMECEEQMKQGNKILRACQQAVTLATMVDEIDVSVDFESQSTADLFQKLIDLIGNSDYLDVDTDTSKPKNTGKKKIDIRARLSNDLTSANVAVHSPAMTAHVNDIDLTPLGIDAEELLETADDDLDLKVFDDQSACMLDKTRVETFDGKEYPLRLGNCWHVAMTTYPKINPEKPTEKLHIPKDASLSILTRETPDGHKEVKILLGDNEIKLMPSSSQPKVYVNGQMIEISDTKSHQEKSKDDIIFDIFKLGDHSIGIVSEEYDMSMAFDGMRILIQASDTYRESIRGLCGNFDGKENNDFMGPKKCLFRESDLFTASYALTKNECEGVSLEKAKSIQGHDCTPYVANRQSNVISDAESGRTDTEQGTWGYHHGTQTGEKRCSTHKTHVHETDDKICFTVRPVLACAPGCSATEMKSKNYQLHCMERNEVALSLKKRIEKGARPDLSQKSISMSQRISVPLACTAA